MNKQSYVDQSVAGPDSGDKKQKGGSDMQSSANVAVSPDMVIESQDNSLSLLYDTQLVGIEDKFVNTILNGIKTKQSQNLVDSEPDIYRLETTIRLSVRVHSP